MSIASIVEFIALCGVVFTPVIYGINVYLQNEREDKLWDNIVL